MGFFLVQCKGGRESIIVEFAAHGSLTDFLKIEIHFKLHVNVGTNHTLIVILVLEWNGTYLLHRKKRNFSFTNIYIIMRKLNQEIVIYNN